MSRKGSIDSKYSSSCDSLRSLVFSPSSESVSSVDSRSNSIDEINRTRSFSFDKDTHIIVDISNGLQKKDWFRPIRRRRERDQDIKKEKKVLTPVINYDYMNFIPIDDLNLKIELNENN
jgi:hypothetical protein